MKTLDTILNTMFIEMELDRKYPDPFDPWGDLARMELALITSGDWERYYYSAIDMASIIHDGGWTLINVQQEAIDLLKKYSRMESEGVIYKVDSNTYHRNRVLYDMDSPLTIAYQRKYEEIPF